MWLVYWQRFRYRTSCIQPRYSHALAVHAPGHSPDVAAGLGRGSGADRQRLPADRAAKGAVLEIHVVRQQGVGRVRPVARTGAQRMNTLISPPAFRGPVGRVAFVASNAIGDTLVSMVIVRNLIDHGFDVTVYGTPAHALRQWFPSVAIFPLPQENIGAAFAPYDTVFQMQWNQPLVDLIDVHPHVLTLHDVE